VVFTTDTLAEDCDLTIRMLRCNYIIENGKQRDSAIDRRSSGNHQNVFIKQRFRLELRRYADFLEKKQGYAVQLA